MKNVFNNLLDLVKLNQSLSNSEKESFLNEVNNIDNKVILKSSHDDLSKKYKQIKKELTISIIGIIITILLGVPAYIYYHRDNVRKTRLITSGIDQIYTFIDQKSFSSANDILQNLKVINPSDERLEEMELRIPLNKAFYSGIIPNELIMKTKDFLARNENNTPIMSLLTGIYYIQGNYDQAIALSKDILEISKKNNFDIAVAYTKRNLGSFYIDVDSFTLSNNLLSEAKTILCQDTSSELCIGLILEQARLEYNKENIDSCLKLINRLKLTKMPDIHSLVTLKILESECYLYLEDFENSIKASLEAKAYAKDDRDLRGEIYSSGILSQAYSNIGKYCDKGLEQNKYALDLAKSTNEDLLTIRMVGQGSEVANRCGNNKLAYIYSWIAYKGLVILNFNAMIPYAKHNLDEFNKYIKPNDTLELQNEAREIAINLGVKLIN